MKAFRAFACLALAALALQVAGCNLAGGVTITGTVSGISSSYAGTADISLSGSQTFAASFSVPMPDPQTGSQSGTYEVSGIEKGTYQLVLTYNGYFGSGAYYTVNGGQQVPVTPSQGPLNGNYYDYTITISSISIEEDMTVDVYLGTYSP